MTATRQVDTVNRVPLSISAVSQATLDKQGVKTTDDLSRVVPGFAFSTRGGDRIPQLAIRGIASAAGASTTGVYIDDTPLQKTGLAGGAVTGSGTPLPQIFDLARVEVLKGPQGTLYGGSSEGGTIRFITPTPSLDEYSGRVTTEISQLEHGAFGYNAGMAVGGPLIDGKLGFRASAYGRHKAGYIDAISRFDGSTVEKDINFSNSQAYRLAMLWRVNDRLDISPSLYHSVENTPRSDGIWLNVDQYTIADRSWQANGRPATAPENTAYTLPAHTYGPYDMWGPYRTGNVTNVGDDYEGTIPLQALRNNTRNKLDIGSLSVDYDFGAFSAKLVGSYVRDGSKGINDASYSDTRILTNSPFLYNLPQYFNYLSFDNTRDADTQELRLTSAPGDGPFSWVAGLYRSNARQKSIATVVWNYSDLTLAARGITSTVFYGTPPLDEATYLSAYRDQQVTEDERAIYGEGTWRVTDKFRVIGGLRYSRASLAYDAFYIGQPLGSGVATFENGGLTKGVKVEKPVSPKVGVSYQFSEGTMAFANVAKGFRVGGVNSPAAAAKCASDLEDLGMDRLPDDFNSDSVISYEAGVKARVLERVQINTSVFYIDWKNPQTKVNLPTCGTAYMINAGSATSKGIDATVQAQLMPGLNVGGSLAYTDARYDETVDLIAPTAHPIFVLKGDRLPVPKFSMALNAEYNFGLWNHEAFVRADYQYTGSHQQSVGPGATSYAPDSYMLPKVGVGSIRAGMTVGSFDYTFFINNVTASKDLTGLGGGRASCPDAACTNPRSYNPQFTGSTLRPREFGLTASYNF